MFRKIKIFVTLCLYAALIGKGGEIVEEFEEIYSLYYLDIFKYLFSLSGNKDVAEELTQETFFSAMKPFDTFRGTCKIQTWLCQIAKHAYFAYQKRSNRTQPFEEADCRVEESSLELKISNEESTFKIHQLLHNLSEPYKEVFMLRVFGELSFTKIAALFGKTESWARVTFHRAKLKIIENLEEK